MEEPVELPPAAASVLLRVRSPWRQIGASPPRAASAAPPPVGCAAAAAAVEVAAEANCATRCELLLGSLLLVPADCSTQPNRNLSVCMHSTTESDAAERPVTPAPSSTITPASFVMAVTSALRRRRARAVASAGLGARVTRAERRRR